VHSYTGADPWGRFINELEALPAEFKVIGINDYIFLDGYKRILEEKKQGRLKNIFLFLPVVELRLDKFGGSAGHLSRVNCHIIFSDELPPELIEQQFLNALCSKYVLTPQYDHIRKGGKWAALPTRESLLDLGKQIIDSVPDSERSKFSSPLLEGFNNLCISFETVRDVLERSPYFQNKIVTAVGKTEWAAIKWNDHSIAEKKTIINDADLVFMSASNPEELNATKKYLAASGVNDLLLDCSDAHAFSDAAYKDRLGKCFTWIKADPTFEGLLQVLNEPSERVFLGDAPPSLAHVKNNTTKYINSIRIERKPGASLDETWFHNEVPLNSGLIAVIGNKGKGKSALTDTIGLLCNTRQSENFTFLSRDNFRQQKNNKAMHFEATLTWESTDSITMGLDTAVDSTQPETAKYIPQNLLEKICSQLGRIEESEFDRELKKVIFSHVNEAERLEKDNLDDLIAYRTSESTDAVDILKGELHRINEQIVSAEGESRPEYRLQLENLLSQKQKELEAHDKVKPIEVSKPENDPIKQQEIAEAARAVETMQAQLDELEASIAQTTVESGKQATLGSIATKLLARLDNLERQVQAFIKESRDELQQIGLSVDAIAKISIDREPLFEKQKAFSKLKLKADEELDALIDGIEKRKTFPERKFEAGVEPDPSIDGSLAHKKQLTEKTLEELKTQLDEPNKKYQAYTTELKTWQLQRDGIEGNESEAGTLNYYKKQLLDLALVPQRLEVLYALRIATATEIHKIIRQLAETYRGLYAPVHRFIETRPLVKENFSVNFEVGIVDAGFEDALFDFISHGVSGTFCGVKEAHKLLTEILQRLDFNTEEGIQAFLTEIVECLHNDKRPGGCPVRVDEQIRKGKTVLDLYDTIFSLDYLKPRYALRMGDKELHHLSPGERGALLLVFYLLLDKDDTPLIIDQPEENLDNQTVYEFIVPCIKEARKRRQIMIVTHNPNLAVVCDAEQVICADLDKMDNYKMRYLSGAIENPIINKAIVDILEGTMPAFKNRNSKYHEQDLP